MDEDPGDRQGLPNDVCENSQVQINQDDADSAKNDVDSIEESSAAKLTSSAKLFLMNQVAQTNKKKRLLVC